MEFVNILGSSMIAALGLGLGPVGTPVQPTPDAPADPTAIDVTRRALFVKFKSDGAVYRYDGDDMDSIYYALQRAESAGKFHHAFVRNKYPTTRLPKECDPFTSDEAIAA